MNTDHTNSASPRLRAGSFRRTVVVGTLALVFAGLAVWGQIVLSRRCPVKRPTASAGLFAAFGAFRSLASEIVWFRAERLRDAGRYVELAQLARALTLSDPYTPEVWSYSAWNLAYNVSVMMPDPADRWRWVEAAMRLLRDDGLRLNPQSAELHRELAWLFEFKIGLSTDAASSYYRERWHEIVESVRLRGAWREIGMRPDLMVAIERQLGISDRADPFYSAIYWAELGLRYAPARDTNRVFLEEIVRQSLTLYRKSH